MKVILLISYAMAIPAMLYQFGCFWLAIAELPPQNYTLLIDSRLNWLSGLQNIDATDSDWDKFMSEIQSGEKPIDVSDSL